MEIPSSLFNSYNVAVPRYTSYPTVPFWNNKIDTGAWRKTFQQQFSKENSSRGISLYVHLPFCESLCTYCGCNKKITNNHTVEEEYLRAVLKEWQLYRELVNETPVIREIHLGGGTPTFFSAKNLEWLINGLVKTSIVHPSHDFSLEGHPNNTTREQLDVLFSLGFRRISYGVQDHDAEVQRIINRIQPLENVQKATEAARSCGFTSVNFDLIYGLPRQTIPSIQKTIRQTIELRPDRIAFYSYAHVPWNSRGQRLFDESDLPGPGEKLQLYMAGKELFNAAGYVDIGMDHFTLTTDALYLAWKNGTLHRNFMGYTTQKSGFLLGLGVSSISDLGNAFAQNQKKISQYYESIRKNEFPVFKGHFLNEEDISFRRYILDLSCRGFTEFDEHDLEILRENVFPNLGKLAADGLICFNEKQVSVTKLGHHFIRNICAAFDLFLHRNKQREILFSKAI